MGCSVGSDYIDFSLLLSPPFWRESSCAEKAVASEVHCCPLMGTGASFYSISSQKSTQRILIFKYSLRLSGCICSRPRKPIPALTVPPLLGPGTAPLIRSLVRKGTRSGPTFALYLLSQQGLVSLPSSSHVTQAQPTFLALCPGLADGPEMKFDVSDRAMLSLQVATASVSGLGVGGGFASRCTFKCQHTMIQALSGGLRALSGPWTCL